MFPLLVLVLVDHHNGGFEDVFVPANNRTIALMACAQAACLALGLWIQYRFIIESARWSAGNSAPILVSAVESENRDGDIQHPRHDGTLAASDVLQSLPLGGAVAFIWIGGMQCMVTYLFWSRARTEQHATHRQSEHESMQQVKSLLRTRDAVIFGLAKLAESRDPETGQHLERISIYSTRLAAALRQDPRYRRTITPQFVKSIGISSALHDIGKVGVEDAILLKTSELSDDERQQMQLHTSIGGDCIRRIEVQLGTSNFLEMAREIALFHHERWDGTGYPHGLVGEEIPLAARIVAIADVYDALSVRRTYKNPIRHQKCVEIIRAAAGKHFDAQLVDVFVTIESEFRKIAQKYAETTGALGDESELNDADETIDDGMGIADGLEADRVTETGASPPRKAVGAG